MNIFSIISEGITDQVVLVNMIAGYFNDAALINTRFVFAQPLLDNTNEYKTTNFGGWVNVFQYCRSAAFVENIKSNDSFSEDNYFYIIQIDTDVSNEKGYEVAKSTNVQEYIEAIKQRLILEITDQIYNQYNANIFFAICVNQLECWLLPLLYAGRDKKIMAATENCERRIEEVLQAKLIKTAESYRKLSNDYSKQKNLKILYHTNPSLNIFIQSIERHFHQFESV